MSPLDAAPVNMTFAGGVIKLMRVHFLAFAL
jgi:hypothetical protein